MELMDNLSEQEWKLTDANGENGFVEFVISHRTQTGKGTFKYSILEATEGAPRAPVHLTGAADRDPLKGVQHVMLKIGDGNDNIVGIQVGSDCVVKKN